jgi:hypothetical protein
VSFQQHIYNTDNRQPSSSGLHVHPLTEEGSELGDQISIISSEKQAKGGGLTHQLSDVSRLASAGWHSDISFEPVPSDYAMLKIHTLPPTGGDTLWASGYEIYDRLSSAMQTFLEGLTATHDAKFFLEEAERLGNLIRKDVRGSPLNSGDALTATHPMIRTNRKLPSSSCPPFHLATILTHHSCHGLEIRLRKQRLYQTHQRHHKRRVRTSTPLSLQPRHSEPRCAGTIQVASERPRYLG